MDTVIRGEDFASASCYALSYQMGGIEGGTRKTYPLIPFVGEEIQVATRFK
jgi:hypothetical protein